MKVCAITMVYKDYWALSKWYAHYSAAIGAENLFIVAHGHDPMVSRICQKANVITIPRDDFTGFDRMRGHMLNSIQDGLGIVFDWVIRTDADELIVLDPEYHGTFFDLLRSFSGKQSLFALGLNVAEEAGTHYGVFSGHYSKAWAVKRGTHLVRHGVTLTDDAEFTLPVGVYLVHLKFANIQALEHANKHRMEIASGSEKGLPGKAWAEAGRHSKRFYEKLSKLPLHDWATASADAYETVECSPYVDELAKILRARSFDFAVKVEVPDWMKIY